MGNEDGRKDGRRRREGKGDRYVREEVGDERGLSGDGGSEGGCREDGGRWVEGREERWEEEEMRGGMKVVVHVDGWQKLSRSFHRHQVARDVVVLPPDLLDRECPGLRCQLVFVSFL